MKLTLASNGRILKDSPEIKLPNFVVLTGKNGSGKTQLLRAIGCWEGNREILSDDDMHISNIIYSEPGLYLGNNNESHTLMSNLRNEWNTFYPICFALGAFIENYDFDITQDMIDDINAKINDLIQKLLALTNISNPSIYGMQRQIEYYEFEKVMTLCKKSKKNHLLLSLLILWFFLI
ncbi:hypothetical protein BWI96_18865 [Siphonobacter sp. SORGH_AS_0500]|uniref:hypothetical protein n=1 Tax=Siphonobacter sp. SORGH_AS_0500 TaxID=1864824 RepID=UPI000CC4C288|nr:hypothetical protein [Siphonobacter sp. SORGH_AS_0500]PKK35116.1 hypothetical protein BWI96_18865 [Siphonobacter sp. SORGH_AS_0500]